MKKKATVLIASIMAFCGINTAHADEGMWTIYNLPNAVYEMMQREGFSMTYDQLYNGENALKNAVVNFSGYCSGVVVSPDGLVFTNHHCGFEAIRSHSTVEHDYMLNGFFAKSYAEELPNENMFVSFMVGNYIAIPAATLILYLGAALILFSPLTLWAPIAPVVAPLISLTSGALTSITQFLNTAIKLISMLPGASIENVRISLPQVIGLYAIILLIYALWRRIDKQKSSECKIS